MPDSLDDGVVYVAMEYRTAVHKCFCGCGSEVATALSPTDWKLTYDGVSVSLYPSIGNWALDCQSHYWIDRNAVKWAGQWSKEQIEAGRVHDRMVKDRYYGKPEVVAKQEAAPQAAQRGLVAWIKSWFD
ncbi:MAG: DUF6527 family protein [Pseudomonadota bacterium]